MARYIEAERLTEYITAEGILNGAYSEEEIIANLSCMIDEIPTADVQEVVHGEWKEVYDINSQDYNSDNNWWVRCSCCQNHTKISFRKQRFGYCPNCGTKMDGGEE